MAEEPLRRHPVPLDQPFAPRTTHYVLPLLGRVQRESQFSLLYKRLFGITPMRGLIHVRLSLARHYLTSYELTVTEVARLCGFADASYFSKCFRRHVGHPPSVLRRS